MKTYTDYEIIKAAEEYLSSHKTFTGHRTTLSFRGLVCGLTGWTIWTGGECPVSPGTVIYIMLREGLTDRRDDPRGLDWRHSGCALDIIAYRILEPDISELRGWCLVEHNRHKLFVNWASEEGLSDSPDDACYLSWEGVRSRGWKVRKLTAEDVSDE